MASCIQHRGVKHRIWHCLQILRLICDTSRDLGLPAQIVKRVPLHLSDPDACLLPHSLGFGKMVSAKAAIWSQESVKATIKWSIGKERLGTQKTEKNKMTLFGTPSVSSCAGLGLRPPLGDTWGIFAPVTWYYRACIATCLMHFPPAPSHVLSFSRTPTLHQFIPHLRPREYNT